MVFVSRNSPLIVTLSSFSCQLFQHCARNRLFKFSLCSLHCVYTFYLACKWLDPFACYRWCFKYWTLLFFAGCSATSDDGSARRLRIFKHITDLFQTVNLSTEVTTELTGMLLNEVLYSVTEISIISWCVNFREHIVEKIQTILLVTLSTF